MATTYTIHNVIATPVTTSVPTLPRTNLKIHSQTRGNDGSVETIYRLMTADEDHPMSIRVGIYPKAGACNYSVSIETGMTGVDGEGTETFSGKIRAVLALTVPKASGVGDATQIMSLLGNLFSMWYDGVTSAVPNENVLDMFSQGIAEIDA